MSGPHQYTKKPVTISAMQYTGPNASIINTWTGGVFYKVPEQDKMRVATREGHLDAEIGDFIIRGIEGEFYPCGEQIFHKTYNPVT